MFITSLLLSTFAHATPVVSKDWKLESCVASTSVTDKTGTYRLEVAIDPAHVMPLEVRIIPSVAVGSGRLALDKKTVYAFAAESDGTLWNIPRGTLNLITYLKREAKAVVDLGTSKVAFSLRGSSAALQGLQKDCNGAQEFGSDGFERAFLPAVVATVDPSTLKPADVDHLRDLIRTALAAFRSSADTQTALNALSNQYLAQISEYEQLRKNVDKLTHDTVVRLQKRHDDATANIAAANTEIPQLKAQVASQEAALQPANTALDSAKADLAPLYPTLQRYKNAISDAQNEVSNRQSDLQQAQAYEAQTRSHLQQVIDGVNQAASAINDLQNEIASLRNDLSNAQDFVNRAQRDWQNAQYARQSFNKYNEVQRRLSSDSRLSSIDYSLRDAQGRLPGAQAHISQAEQDRATFGAQLHDCQATPGADCSHQQDLANRAELRMQQAQNEYNDLQNRIRDLQSQHDNFRLVIEREVDADYDVLCRNESQAQACYNNAVNKANQIVSQINQMQGPDLSQAQSNLASWRNAQAQAESDVRSAADGTASAARNVQSAQNGVDAATSRLASWKQSSGYNAKSRTLSNAQAAVDQINSTLNSLDRKIAADEKLIRDETASLADTETQMQAALATIKQKEDRSAEVQQLLAPYFQQRDALVVQKAAFDQTFKDAQLTFAQALTPVPPAPAPAPTPAPTAAPQA